jgi:hypothetical protein
MSGHSIQKQKPRNNMKALFGTGNLSEVYDF